MRLNLLQIYAEWDEYTGQKPVWIKTVKCTPYTIIFNNPSEIQDDEYAIIDKKGKHVGILKNSKGSFFYFIFFIYLICNYALLCIHFNYLVDFKVIFDQNFNNS